MTLSNIVTFQYNFYISHHWILDGLKPSSTFILLFRSKSSISYYIHVSTCLPYSKPFFHFGLHKFKDDFLRQA